MVFVVVQIKCQGKVLKPWYECSFAESSKIADLYTHYSTGQLDDSDPLDRRYIDAVVKCRSG